MDLPRFKRLVVRLFAAGMIVGANTACVDETKSVLPETATITPPPPDLAPDLAGLSGVWAGELFWGSKDSRYHFDAQIAIEKIDDRIATVTVAYGELLTGTGQLESTSHGVWYEHAVVENHALHSRRCQLMLSAPTRLDISCKRGGLTYNAILSKQQSNPDNLVSHGRS